MNAPTMVADANVTRAPDLSALARHRFEHHESTPLFLADWMDVLFIHYEVDPTRLQASVPFELDLLDGRAFVSLVAFSMRRLRPAFGGALTALPFKIVGETRFLNVRTYVRHNQEAGIYFIKEFMSSRLSAPLGPLTYGLPYHLARLDYDCRDNGFAFDGRIRRTEGHERRLRFHASFKPDAPAANRSTAYDEGLAAEFLTEQYTAYTCHRGDQRLFRIWHKPWKLHDATVAIEDHDLLETSGDWLKGARFVSAQYSPGMRDVWMGRPHRVPTTNAMPDRRHRHGAFLELP